MKQYRRQGDPKTGDTEAEKEKKEAAVTLPPIDDLMQQAEEALSRANAAREAAIIERAKRWRRGQYYGDMPCPICCVFNCDWPNKASEAEFENAVANSHCKLFGTDK